MAIVEGGAEGKSLQLTPDIGRFVAFYIIKDRTKSGNLVQFQPIQTRPCTQHDFYPKNNTEGE